MNTTINFPANLSKRTDMFNALRRMLSTIKGYQAEGPNAFSVHEDYVGSAQSLIDDVCLSIWVQDHPFVYRVILTDPFGCKHHGIGMHAFFGTEAAARRQIPANADGFSVTQDTTASLPRVVQRIAREALENPQRFSAQNLASVQVLLKQREG